MVSVKVKVYAFSSIVIADSTCTLDFVVLLDWLDPSLAIVMQKLQKFPSEYDVKGHGHFCPKFEIHNASEAVDEQEGDYRVDQEGWQKGHAKLTIRYALPPSNAGWMKSATDSSAIHFRGWGFWHLSDVGSKELR